MPTKTLFLETTNVAAERTVSEVAGYLVQAGASQIAMQYEAKRIVGLRFALEIPRRGTVVYILPARVDPVFNYLANKRKYTYDGVELRRQAERVAWRQLYLWVKSQVAMIETGMVEAGEVFLPYTEAPDGRTLWEFALSGGQLALPPAKDEK